MYSDTPIYNIYSLISIFHKKIICGIYKITSPSGRIYIGQSKNIINRWKHYKKVDCKHQHILYHSFKKYGIENHKFEIIKRCNIEELNYWERYHQDFYIEKGYKLASNLMNCILTETKEKKKILSEVTKRKLSEAARDINGEKNPFYGKKHTEATRKLMSENHWDSSGKNHPMYGKTGELCPFYGRKHTEESKKLMSITQSGHGAIIQKCDFNMNVLQEATIDIFQKENFNRGHIYQCCWGREVHHKGFIWKYKDDDNFVIPDTSKYKQRNVRVKEPI